MLVGEYSCKRIKKLLELEFRPQHAVHPPQRCWICLCHIIIVPDDAIVPEERALKTIVSLLRKITGQDEGGHIHFVGGISLMHCTTTVWIVHIKYVMC